MATCIILTLVKTAQNLSMARYSKKCFSLFPWVQLKMNPIVDIRRNKTLWRGSPARAPSPSASIALHKQQFPPLVLHSRERAPCTAPLPVDKTKDRSSLPSGRSSIAVASLTNNFLSFSPPRYMSCCFKRIKFLHKLKSSSCLLRHRLHELTLKTI